LHTFFEALFLTVVLLIFALSAVWGMMT